MNWKFDVDASCGLVTDGNPSKASSVPPYLEFFEIISVISFGFINLFF